MFVLKYSGPGALVGCYYLFDCQKTDWTGEWRDDESDCARYVRGSVCCNGFV